MSRRPFSPVDTLLPFQRPTFDDKSRFVIGLWSRQTGKSHVGTLRAVTDCITTPGALWVILSAGERQALEAMLKARGHTDAWKVALSDYTETRDSAEAVLKVAEMRWPNGSRLIAIPANPATARGYSANLLLDEFAYHEDPDAIWRAIYPSISNPIKGQKRVLILSTPNGLGNKFADLWHSEDLGWSKHKVTIHDAVKGGLEVDIEELRRGLNDPEGWAQEYECEFLDAAAVLLPYELIAGCESAEATTAMSPEWWQTVSGRPVFIGWDFARKRDLSVPWVSELIGDVLHTREVIEFRGMSTPDQVDAMDARIRLARRVCVDYTGPGIGLGDELVKRHREWDPEKHQFGKIELVTFTNAKKLELFPALRVAFEKRALRVPVNRAIREDLHSMQRVSTTSGNVTYRAPHTDDGHADRCTSLALCLRAAGSGTAGALQSVEGIRFTRSPLKLRRFEPRGFRAHHFHQEVLA